MEKIKLLEKQILELKIEKYKRSSCHVEIGQYVLSAFENGEIKDGELNLRIEKIISEVKVTDREIRGLQLY